MHSWMLDHQLGRCSCYIHRSRTVWQIENAMQPHRQDVAVLSSGAADDQQQQQQLVSDE